MVVPNGSVNMNNQGCLKDVQAAFACQMHLKLAYNFCILLFGQIS